MNFFAAFDGQIDRRTAVLLVIHNFVPFRATTLLLFQFKSITGLLYAIRLSRQRKEIVLTINIVHAWQGRPLIPITNTLYSSRAPFEMTSVNLPLSSAVVVLPPSPSFNSIHCLTADTSPCSLHVHINEDDASGADSRASRNAARAPPSCASQCRERSASHADICNAKF